MDWLTQLRDIAISTVFSTISFLAVIKLIGKNFIEEKFKEKIEAYKYTLDLLMEKEKHKYAQNIQDFNLWTAKRHEAYASLHNAMFLAASNVLRLRGIHTGPDYARFDKDEILKELNKHSFLESDRKYIYDNWDMDKTAAMKRFEELEKLRKENEAEYSFREARNMSIYANLYLSNDIIELLNELTDNIWYLLTEYRSQYYTEEKDRKVDRYRSIIENDLIKMSSMMKKELSGK